MSGALLPDVEQIISTHLRAGADVTAIVDDRVYTELPANAQTPLLRVTRLGGAPVRPNRRWLDGARIQTEAYGGSKKLAHTLAQTAAARLAEAPAAIHTDGAITEVTFGELLWLPDDTWLTDAGKARPRYLFDATVFAHP